MYMLSRGRRRDDECTWEAVAAFSFRHGRPAEAAATDVPVAGVSLFVNTKNMSAE